MSFFEVVHRLRKRININLTRPDSRAERALHLFFLHFLLIDFFLLLVKMDKMGKGIGLLKENRVSPRIQNSLQKARLEHTVSNPITPYIPSLLCLRLMFEVA